MKTFFIRGLLRVLDVLKADYMQTLQQFGLLKPLIQVLMQNESDEIELCSEDPWFVSKLSSSLI